MIGDGRIVGGERLTAERAELCSFLHLASSSTVRARAQLPSGALGRDALALVLAMTQSAATLA